LLAWIERINERPAVREMFARSQSEMPSRAPAPVA
jgi:glutathione S-transferase